MGKVAACHWAAISVSVAVAQWQQCHNHRSKSSKLVEILCKIEPRGRAKSRVLTFGSLCLKFLCVINLTYRFANCSRVSANSMSHAGCTDITW